MRNKPFAPAMNEFWTGVYILATVVFIAWVVRGSRRTVADNRPPAAEGDGGAPRAGRENQR